jgi:hypothetical protein
MAFKTNKKGDITMNEEMMRKIDGLFENVDFEAAFFGCEDEDSLLRLLSENGVEISKEELQDMIRMSVQHDDWGELEEDALEAVAGGRAKRNKIVKGLITLVKKWGKSFYNGVIKGNPKSAFKAGYDFEQYLDEGTYAYEK